MHGIQESQHIVVTGVKGIPPLNQFLVAKFPSNFGIVGDDLAAAEEFPFVDDEAFESDGAAGFDNIGTRSFISHYPAERRSNLRVRFDF